MREQVRQIFASFPPEGIAMHGTNLSRAQAIKDSGFIQDSDPVFFLVQPPSHANPHNLINRLMWGLNDVSKHSLKTTTLRRYKFSNDERDKIPAIVLFRPPPSDHRSEYVYENCTYEPIPAGNIVGFTVLVGSGEQLPFFLLEARAYWRKQFINIINIVTEKGIIGSAGSRQSPAR